MTARTSSCWMLSACCVWITAIGACRGPDTPGGEVGDLSGNDNTGEPSAASRLLGAATRGDVVTYETNADDQSYTWVNETTGMSGGGTFARLAGNEYARGFYELTEDGQTYYGLKLAEDLVVTDNPTGHEDNKLAIVLRADVQVDHASFTGEYFYVWMDDGNTQVEWGAARINDDNTFTYHSYRGARPEDAGQLSFDGTGEGTWALADGDDDGPTRIEFVLDNATLVGMVLPGRAFVLDRGEGNGLWVGVRIPEVPLQVADITGIYQHLDISYEDPAAASVKLGLYRVNEDSTVDIVSLSGADLADPSSWNLVQGIPLIPVDNVNNMFKATITTGEQNSEAYAIFFPGEVLMHFDFREGQFVGYGVGVAQDAAD